jgi:hypothetical protein
MRMLSSIAAAALTAAALAGGASTSTTALPGLMTTKAPWPANNASPLRERLRAAGIPALGAEGSRVHIHQHLDIVINGKGYRIPAGIGIDSRGRFISPLHTHDISGIIHLESPTTRRYTLGNLFDVWGLRFSSRCIGGYCVKGKKKVWVYVDGKRVVDDPRAIVLRAHDEIVAAYGTFASIPKPIPPAYPFPAGY